MKSKLTNPIITILLLSMQSCQSAYHGEQIDSSIFGKRISSKIGLITSCIRCSCIDDIISSNEFITLFSDKIPIYADSNCFKPKGNQKVIHISQSLVDSVYEKNFNLILFKYEKDKLMVRILKTKEADKFGKIFIQFFDLLN